MTYILCIDTSTDICSVVLGCERGVLFERVSYEGRDHSKKAGVFVDEVMHEAQEAGIDKPDAVAVCAGPGSYTGLRIGVSLSKGLCYGYEVPLIAIDSLEVMVREVIRRKVDLNPETILLPMIDARRMEIYLSHWRASSQLLSAPKALVVDERSFEAYSGQPLCYFGTGAEKCQLLMTNEKWSYIPDITPMAAYLLTPALVAYANEQFEDVAYFEPFYLKQFQTTVSKKNLLGL